MKISVDTNVLVRAVLLDDSDQAEKAVALLKEASLVAVSLPCLCELAWVLLRAARLPKKDVGRAIRALLGADNIVMNRPAVEAGLAVLDAGGDFADGIMAFEGKWLGGQTFVSFDKQAVSLLEKQGYSTRRLS